MAHWLQKNKDDSEDGSRERFSNTRLLRSFQIAQIIACKHKNLMLLETFPDKDILQEGTPTAYEELDTLSLVA